MTPLRIDSVKVGDVLLTDNDFTCMPADSERTVEQDTDGLFIRCDAGKHYLDGQVDDDGIHYVGLRGPEVVPVPERVPGHDAAGNYSTAQMLHDDIYGGDTSQPLDD